MICISYVLLFVATLYLCTQYFHIYIDLIYGTVRFEETYQNLSGLKKTRAFKTCTYWRHKLNVWFKLEVWLITCQNFNLFGVKFKIINKVVMYAITILLFLCHFSNPLINTVVYQKGLPVKLEQSSSETQLNSIRVHVGHFKIIF